MDKLNQPVIVFEDESLVVIEKPFGVVSNRAESVKGTTVQEWHRLRIGLPEVAEDQQASEFLQKSGLVHRLDKDTSGVMVLAKTEEAYENLKMQFLERKAKKKYWALVHGISDKESGLVSKPIVRHPGDRHKFTVGEDLSRMAITQWTVESRYKVNKFRSGNEFSLLMMEPHTGRTHQLRVHLKYLNLPIVSDPIYGGRKQLRDDLLWCPRLFLHAYQLVIVHPKTGLEVRFEAQLPADLKSALESLEIGRV